MCPCKVIFRIDGWSTVSFDSCISNNISNILSMPFRVNSCSPFPWGNHCFIHLNFFVVQKIVQVNNNLLYKWINFACIWVLRKWNHIRCAVVKIVSSLMFSTMRVWLFEHFISIDTYSHLFVDLLCCRAET